MSVKYLKAYTYKQAKKIMDEFGLDTIYDNGKLCAELYHDNLYDGCCYFIKWHGFDLFHLERSFKFEIYNTLYKVRKYNGKIEFILLPRLDGNKYLIYKEEITYLKNELFERIKGKVIKEYNKDIEKTLNILNDKQSSVVSLVNMSTEEFKELLSKWVESQTY